MDYFNEYLKGRKFILYTDHKPLEKLGHLHSKIMNWFQTALLKHDFIMQYKKGSDMPADFLSRLPPSSEASMSDVVAAFDPFQTDLQDLQQEEPILQKAFFYNKHHRWPDQMTKAEETSLREFLKRLITDKNGTIWVWLNDYKYPRTALLLPKKYPKEALC